MPAPFTPLVASLPASVPFVGPEAQERARGVQFRARLGANESAFGPSPAAVAAMAEAASGVWQYGDPENHELRQALASTHSVDPGRIAIGEGIDGLLGLIVRMVVDNGAPVVTSAGAYPTFGYHVNGFGGRLVSVPYTDDHEDADGLIEAAAQEDAPLVYLANPDNPMGSWHSADRLRAVLDALPDNTLLILDEAYVEFAPKTAVLPMAVEHPRLVRLRTFSKAYGMAGARVGYAVTTPELADAFNKVRNHFGVNRIAQAGACAALDDTEHLHHSLTAVSQARARIGAIGAAHGLTPLPSATNFVALDTGGNGCFARALVGALAERGVFVRMPFVAPQDRCIRVTAGPEAMLSVFEAELGPSLDAARASTAACAAE